MRPSGLGLFRTKIWWWQRTNRGCSDHFIASVKEFYQGSLKWISTVMSSPARPGEVCRNTAWRARFAQCTRGCARTQRALPFLAAARVRAPPLAATLSVCWHTGAALSTSGQQLHPGRSSSCAACVMLCLAQTCWRLLCSFMPHALWQFKHAAAASGMS